jgi:hypothetical protein
MVLLPVALRNIECVESVSSDVQTTEGTRVAAKHTEM